MSADLRRILVACRGELAQRLIALYHSLGIEVVVAFSAAEPDAAYLEDADYDVYLGDGDHTVWWDAGRVVSAAMDAGCDAVHPGYGELARSLELYRAASAANLGVIGVDPRRAPEALDRARVLATVREAGFDVPPWELVPPRSDGIEVAARVGVPLLASGTHGPERRVSGFEQLGDALVAVRAAGEGQVLLVHTVDASPVAVVVAGDRSGRVVALGTLLGAEVVELPAEDPHPWLVERSVQIAAASGFVGIGSVLWRMTSGERAWFVGFQPHLPVAYDLVERVCGVDLTELQHGLVVGQALGEPPARAGHGVQAQVWSAGTGAVARLDLPRVDGVDVITVLAPGGEVGADADPLLAKLTTSAPDPAVARASLTEALRGLRIDGVPNRLSELRLAFEPARLA